MGKGPGITHRLALERPPHDRSVADRVLCIASAWHHAAFGDADHIHNADDIVGPGAGAFDVLVQESHHQVRESACVEDFPNKSSSAENLGPVLERPSIILACSLNM